MIDPPMIDHPSRKSFVISSESPHVAHLPSPVQGALSPMQHLQQEYYMYEVIVVWSCELLQQLSNVMIAGESSAQPPAADWTAHSHLGTIN